MTTQNIDKGALWKRGSFQQIFSEARGALVQLHGYGDDLLGCCNEGADFSAVQANFNLADRYYKEVKQGVNHLSLWHAAKVEGRQVSEWTQREIEQDALLRSLDKGVSSTMDSLLSVYRIWLVKEQFIRPIPKSEDDVGAP
jgi:hypothetical protein